MYRYVRSYTSSLSLACLGPKLCRRGETESLSTLMNKSAAGTYGDNTPNFSKVWQTTDAEDGPSSNVAVAKGGQTTQSNYESISSSRSSQRAGLQKSKSLVLRAPERETKRGVSGRMGSLLLNNKPKNINSAEASGNLQPSNRVRRNRRGGVVM